MPGPSSQKPTPPSSNNATPNTLRQKAEEAAVPEAPRPADHWTNRRSGCLTAAKLERLIFSTRFSSIDLIVRTTMRELKRLQRRHDGGRKWDPVPAGPLRRGQRTKDELQHRNQD